MARKRRGLQPGDAGLPGGIGHSLGDSGAYPLVKGLGDDIVGGQLLVGDQPGQRLGGGHFHLLVDVAGPDVEGPPEHARESQDVVETFYPVKMFIVPK